MIRWRTPAVLLLAWLGALPAPSCRRSGRPVLLLVTIDTLRADHLGCYGYSTAATPVIDALAHDGTRFTAASTATPLTLPAHATILTGRYPRSTGVRNNGMFTLPREELTLAEALKAAGYKTGAFVGAFVLSSSFGLSQGFDIYDESFDMKRQGPTADERRADAVNAAVFRWLERRPPGPLFLWVHYFDPHARYEPPPPFDRQFASSPYDGEIANVDQALGKLLERLRSVAGRGEIAVVLVADHGEGLGEHGEATHGLFVYESTLHVPLILWAPGRIPAGATVTEPVSVVDVFDTALALAGVEAPSAAPRRHGVNLLPLTRAHRVTRPLPVTFESYLSRLEFGWSELRGVRDGPEKLIHAPRSELFDLSTDSGEIHDDSSEQPAEVVRLREEMEASYESQSASAGAGEARSAHAADEETIERLRGLGYVTAGTTVAGSPTAGLPDPKDRLDEYNRLKAAGDAVTQGPEGVKFAVATLRQLLKEDPGSIAGQWRYAEALLMDGRPADVVSLLEPHLNGGVEYYWLPWLLAKAHRAMGEREKALALYREAARRSSFFQSRPLEIISLLREMGKFEESLEEALRAAEKSPADALLLQIAGDDCRDLHRKEQAMDFYRRALSASPGQVGAAVSLCALLLEERRYAEAEDMLIRLLEAAPEAPEGNRMMGLVLINRGRLGEAAERLSRARALDPHDPGTLYYLVVCFSQSGRLGEAETAVAELLRVAPASSHSYRALGLLRQKQGRRAEASDAYRRALALDPSDSAASRGLREVAGG